MTSSLPYPPRRHRELWCAFAAAILFHLAAIALAAGRAHTASDIGPSSFGVAIEGEPETQATPEPIDLPSLPPPAMPDHTNWAEENPAPVKPRDRTLVSPICPSGNVPGPMAVKAFALSAPRPAYPYEARRQRITGSGTARLVIDTQTGRVMEVTMSQSTGSFILDNATVSGLRGWRFKLGAPPTITVPITFTLTGATY